MPVAVPIAPRRLIEHARELAHHQTGAGRPRAISLRRAVSAAYYAVFHSVSLHVAQHLLPNSSWDDRYRLARSVEHGALKEVCQWASGTGAGKRHVVPLVAALQADPDISLVAGIASRLQEARHLADYDHLAAFGKASVLTSINEAELAIDRLDGLVGQPNLETLLSLVALQSKLR